MGKIDKDAFYFPHFSNARHDRKIKRLRKELGLEGYGIFFMLLEVLRDQADYAYPFEDVDLLADEFGTSEQKVRATIANYGLFEVDEREHFFSSNLIMYLGPFIEAKNKARIDGIKGNLVRWHGFTHDDFDGKTDEQIIAIQRDIKVSGATRNPNRPAIASKVKESKVNKNKEIEEEFDRWWSVYPKKKDKKNAKKKYVTFKKSGAMPELEAHIDIIKQWAETDEWKKQGGQFIPNGSTWINGERWNDELPKKNSIKPFQPNVLNGKVEYL